MSLIHLMKVDGALVSPNGMTSHSDNPKLFLNVVFHVSATCILTWW